MDRINLFIQQEIFLWLCATQTYLHSVYPNLFV